MISQSPTSGRFPSASSSCRLSKKRTTKRRRAKPFCRLIWKRAKSSFSTRSRRPLGSYLESSKGKRCCVFLVNGQRQESLDNSFIVQELGFKYLRNRMMIVVD